VTQPVRKVAVLGAGTMGAAIAAQCANAGLDVELLDVAAPTGDDRDAVTRAGFERMRKARPAALMGDDVAARIRLGNFEDNLDRLADADWIMEAIVERIEPKRQLMQRVEQLATPAAIVSSNTSGIPLHTLAEGRSDAFKAHFLGTHFFNPPRYLKLLELIPTDHTDPLVVETMRTFAERALGKGVVIARDTPDFIANRLGTFAGMQTIRYAFDTGFTIEEVDAITGPLIGRPGTATFRLHDQVGLDIAVGVAENIYPLIPADESRDAFKPHPKLKEMVARNLLGNKTGAGFYQRTERDGKTVFDVVDLETFNYRPAASPAVPIVKEAQPRGDLGARLRFLMSSADDDRDARYVRDTLLPYLAYASRRVPEISHSLDDVDHAMEWGYGHEAGPFRTWDLLGARQAVGQMKSLGIQVADWVEELLATGNESFYRRQEGQDFAYSPVDGTYLPLREDPLAISLDRLRAAGKELRHNDSASLLDLGDGVLCLEFHSKANSIDAGVRQMGFEALRALARDGVVGLVIGNQGHHFCVGANLADLARSVREGRLDEVGASVDELHELLMGFRFAAKPVVAAPHGQTLGGGLEFCLHADRIVAAAETYMGFAEPGVGLIPGGGGTKEMARRVVSAAVRLAPDTPPLPSLQKAFDTIAMARVSGSALEARALGFLSDADRIVMNPEHVLAAAKTEVLGLAEDYAPPWPNHTVYAAGRWARAALEVGVKTLQWGRYASEYDGVIATDIARVLTGGDLSLPQWVPEEYLLQLEKEAFLSLLRNDKTQARIVAMLESGKPLRN
jgi:3-hydroxyacyl-CoA dehydrogenase